MTRSRRPPLAAFVAVAVVLSVTNAFSKTPAALEVKAPQAILVQTDQVTE